VEKELAEEDAKVAEEVAKVAEEVLADAVK
jgi:hypothetical protein